MGWGWGVGKSGVKRKWRERLLASGPVKALTLRSTLFPPKCSPQSPLSLSFIFFFLPVKNTNTLLQFVTKASPPSCGCGSWTMLGALLVLWVHFKSSKQHTFRNNGCFHCWCGQMSLFLFPFSSEFKILFKMCHNYHHSTINKPLCMLWTTVVL